ncbi:preprotein translocase subunit YajC [Pseudolysinimonas sp.]|uniref:preprotein translocase subunit YajC n=1 Tax=Pseudolysinimonas sp. TaxID=2680009 RepID=UPI003F7D4292
MSSLATLLPAATTPTSSGNFFQDNFLTIALVLVLAVMVIFMVRNSRKRKRDAEELQNKFVPGAEVMTQHGIYGTLVSVDEEKNEAIIETTPGTRLRVHRQTVARVIDPVDIDPEKDIVHDEEPASTEAPEFGERVVDETPAATDAEESKPAPAPRTSAASTRSTSSTAKPRKKPAEGDAAE